MNEIITIYQLLQHLPLLHLGVGVIFVLLLITKNNFSQPLNIPHNSHTSFFLVFTFLFAVVPLVYFGWGFYQAYFPDYRYEQIASQLDSHLYRPNYLPSGVVQETPFTISDKPLFPNSPTVNVVFATRIEDTISEPNNQFIIVMQSKAPADFSLLPYIQQRDETSAPLTTTPKEITIASFPGTMAYLVQQELINQVWLLTKDNVLIVLSSPIKSTSAEELIKIVESLH